MTRVAAVDIGTNSMRMLIADDGGEVGRWEVVTGLGRGVDRSGVLSDAGMGATLPVLGDYGQLMDGHGVTRRRAIATSASRDAANREVFFDMVEETLGVRPELITGTQEARLAYAGATAGFSGPGPWLVSDIGGGSTEFVTADTAVSVDIGSVRLTERALPERPATGHRLDEARSLVTGLLAALEPVLVGSLIGVAGTWTELPGLATGRDEPTITASAVTGVVEMLAGLTVEETARLPTLNPDRAGVILGGAVIAEAVMGWCHAPLAHVTVHDTLDGVVMGLLAQCE
ncbi:MAG: exopolyphosphatase [Actinobacteria bacterium]|nr:exopolyphosphatase [Actinomycetota bacterium]